MISYKKPAQSIDQLLAKKYEQVANMLDKYYEKIGARLFSRKTFKMEGKPLHKIAKSLISFISSDDNLK